MLFIFSQEWGAGKFFSGSGSWIFFQSAPALGFFSSGSGFGSKMPKTPGSDRLRLPIPEFFRNTKYIHAKKQNVLWYSHFFKQLYFPRFKNVCLYLRRIFVAVFTGDFYDCFDHFDIRIITLNNNMFRISYTKYINLYKQINKRVHGSTANFQVIIY